MSDVASAPLSRSLPPIIQGGMGVAVSGWRLAKTVSQAGQLGVVSGTALDVVLVRRLQQGDPDGDVRRALAAFPSPEVAQRIQDRYFVPGGVPDGRGSRPRRCSRSSRSSGARSSRFLAGSSRCSWRRRATTGSSGSTSWRRSSCQRRRRSTGRCSPRSMSCSSARASLARSRG